MTLRKAALLGFAWLAFGSGPAAAQTFQKYRCADGVQFELAFFPADTHAHLQLDGKAVTLAKKLSFTGKRYRGGGIDLFITDEGAVLKRRRMPASGCTPL